MTPGSNCFSSTVVMPRYTADIASPRPPMWNNGATMMLRSPWRRSEVASMLASQAMFAACDISAPFGRPVVPLVYIM